MYPMQGFSPNFGQVGNNAGASQLNQMNPQMGQMMAINGMSFLTQKLISQGMDPASMSMANNLGNSLNGLGNQLGNQLGTSMAPVTLPNDLMQQAQGAGVALSGQMSAFPNMGLSMSINNLTQMQASQMALAPPAPPTNPPDDEDGPGKRPDLSYAQLIARAIYDSTDHKATVREPVAQW